MNDFGFHFLYAQVTEVIPQQFGDPRTVEITESTPNHKCCFCHRHELNPTEWGAMLQLDDITTHYFCLVSLLLT